MDNSSEAIVKKVLVADDEPAVIYSVDRILRDKYTVIKASSGEEAVKQANRYMPDIILMDMLMPVKDGLTACKEIKSRPTTRDIPVIMLSGVGFELNKKLATAMGASGFITKPFKPQELLDTVDGILSVQTA